MSGGWSYFLDFRGEHFELEPRELTTGRSRTCDVSIKDPSVSRRHVILEPGDGIIVVKDLGSSNGTFINGSRIEGTGELADGDVLGLGDADIAVRVESPAAMETVRLEAPAAAAPRPDVGEATAFLQAESVKLAQDALGEEPPAAAPGSHMAPPPVRASETPQAPPPAAPPAASPMATMRLPTIEDPPPVQAGGEPPVAADASPMATMRLPTLPEDPAAPAAEANAPPRTPSPMATLEIPTLDAGPPPQAPEPDSPMATLQIPTLDAGPPPQASEPASPLADDPVPEIDDRLRPDETAEPATAATPAFELPTDEVPGFAPPPAEIPDFEPPAAEVPEFEASPAAELPEFEASPAAELPEFEAPPAASASLELPYTEAPGLEPATGDTSGLELPSVETPEAVPEIAMHEVGEPLAATIFEPPEPAPPVDSPAAAPQPPPVPPSIPAPAPTSAPAPSQVSFEPGPVADVRTPEPPPPSFPPPTPLAASPAPPAAEPATGGVRNLDDSVGDVLGSLEGFDNTLAPGAELPESMQRARENVVKMQEAVPATTPNLYSQPLQVPPMADFFTRTAGGLLDAAWIGLLGAGGWFAMQQLGAAGACAVSLLVVLLGWSVWGTTPGKRVLGLFICDEEGQAGIGFGRTLLRLLVLPLGILGFPLMLTAARRGLHDRIAGTYVRRYR